MILRPLVTHAAAPEQGEPEPAWVIVARSQSLDAPQYLLVGQPDHARLSGELAAMLRAPFLSPIDSAVVKAIAVHDDGWGGFPFERDLQGDPPLTSSGRPQHFMQVTLQESLSAWTGSIKSAGEVSPLAEYMVSSHFSRIGQMRIQLQMDPPADLDRLKRFVRDEQAEQSKLQARTGLSVERLTEYVDLLQFCDLLSLYLCCGATQTAEFPQQFNGTLITIRCRDGAYITQPSVFRDSRDFYVPARVYPSQGGAEHTRLDFHLK